MAVLEGWVASLLSQQMGSFATTHRLGRVIVESLFWISHSPDRRRRPDLAFVSAERWPLSRQMPGDAAWDVVPDLAVEVVSPSNTFNEIVGKLAEYFRAGTKLVWVVLPREAQVYAYGSPKDVRILDIGDELEGGAVLPGFRLPPAILFGIEPEPGA